MKMQIPFGCYSQVFEAKRQVQCTMYILSVT